MSRISMSNCPKHGRTNFDDNGCLSCWQVHLAEKRAERKAKIALAREAFLGMPDERKFLFLFDIIMDDES